MESDVSYFISPNNMKTIWKKICKTFANKGSVEKLEAKLDRLENAIMNMGGLTHVASLQDIEILQEQINEIKKKL